MEALSMTIERDPEALLTRIDRLERRIAVVTRILAATASLLVLGVAAWLASGGGVASAQGRAAVPAEISAGRFRLVDATGKSRALLYVDDNQAAGLALSDPQGRTRVLLNTDGESSKLAILGTKQDFPRIMLAQQGAMQLFTIEDQTSGIGFTHSRTPSMFIGSEGTTIDLRIEEQAKTRGLVPTLVLRQGDKTLASLPAAPTR
jgi:hypothetical protein